MITIAGCDQGGGGGFTISGTITVPGNTEIDSDVNEINIAPVANDTVYTTRPKLPIMAEDAFVYDVASRLLQKLQDERWVQLARDRDTYLKDLRQTIKLADRQQAKTTRDDAGYSGFADPLERHGWGRSGSW